MTQLFLDNVSTCKRHLNFWVAAEFSSVLNIFVLHPGRGCCFSLGASRFNCFHLRYHHNIGGSSIIRYRSDTISAPFFVVWNVLKVSTEWCYTITKISNLQFLLTAFFPMKLKYDKFCTQLQHLFQTLTKKILTTVDIAHTPPYVLARCVFWADIGSDWYPMLPPDRVTPTSWVWQNPFSNTRLICNCCLTKVPKIRRWK